MISIILDPALNREVHLIQNIIYLRRWIDSHDLKSCLIWYMDYWFPFNLIALHYLDKRICKWNFNISPFTIQSFTAKPERFVYSILFISKTNLFCLLLFLYLYDNHSFYSWTILQYKMCLKIIISKLFVYYRYYQLFFYPS